MSMKQKIAKSLGVNIDLNKKVLRIKKSWDEVNQILKTAQTKTSKK